MSFATNTGIFVSTLNSTTTPLGAAGSFTGTGELITAYQDIDINLFGTPTVAPGTLYFEFSPDNVNWDVSVPYVLTGPNIVPQSLRVVLPYFRIRYVNGATPQTVFRLTTVYHLYSASRLTRFLNQVIDSTEPVENVRAVVAGQKPDGSFGNVTLSPFNSFNVAIGDSLTGAFAAVDPLGTLKVGEPVKLVGDHFDTTALLTSEFTTTIANAGTADPLLGELSLETNTTANGAVNVQSVKRTRFYAGGAYVFQSSVRLNNVGVANNVRRWGAFNPGDAGGSQNGFFFQVSGTTWGVGTRKGGVDTIITSFNGPFPIVMDTSNHLYEIRYDDTVIQFFQDRLLIHSITSASVTPVNNFNFRVGLQNTNSGGITSDNHMYVRSATIYKFGPVDGRSSFRNTAVAETVTLKTSPGSLKRIVINDPGTGTAAITFYDNTAASGTIIATINLVTTVTDLEYDLDFDTGLTYVTNGNGYNVTVIYE